jgi:hypothetical protein
VVHEQISRSSNVLKRALLQYSTSGIQHLVVWTPEYNLNSVNPHILKQFLPQMLILFEINNETYNS